MSLTVNQIERETGATVHFHPNTEVFTKLKIAAMVGGGIIGLTALVVGVLAQLHIIHGIPSPGVDTMMGVGGGLLLIDLAVLIVLSHKHQKAVQPLKEFLECEASQWKGFIQYLKDEIKPGLAAATLIQSTQYECSLSSDGVSYFVHVREVRDEVTDLL